MQNKHEHPNDSRHIHHSQAQTHPHPNTQPPCASKNTPKYPDTISPLSTHGPKGTNTPTRIPQGLSAQLVGKAGPGLVGPLPVHTGLYPYSASLARLPQWPWLWPWPWLLPLPLQLLQQRPLAE